MFTILPNPLIPATLTIVGQGREQSLKLVYRHTPVDTYLGMMTAIGEDTLKPEAAALQLVESWEADAELGEATMQQLQNDQPGVVWAIITGYGQALKVERKGN